MPEEKKKSALSSLENVWDYIAYGVGAGGAILYEWHAGSHNYLTTVNAAGMAAVPARRAAVAGVEKYWGPGKLKKKLETKLEKAKTFFQSDSSVNGSDLVTQADAHAKAWRDELIDDAKFEKELTALVDKYLARKTALTPPPQLPAPAPALPASTAPPASPVTVDQPLAAPSPFSSRDH